MIKKTLSILLCVILMLTTVSFCIQAENDEIRFLLTSDLHYDGTPTTAPNFFPDQKYYVNDSTNLITESKAIVKQFLRQAAETDAEMVLITGDIVDDGTRTDHRTMISLLRDFEQQTGKRVLVINGNHDFNAGISISEFKTLYAEFGYSDALEIDPKTCSYTTELKGKYRLMALDTCNHIDGYDGVTQELLDWADTQVKKAKEDGKELVVMMHHNFLEHIKMQTVILPKYIINPKWDMKQHFIDWGVRYVFTGHQHGRDITAYTDKKTNVRVFDIMTTSLTCYPVAYTSALLNAEGLQLHGKDITAVDAADLPKSGYTSELLQELTTDLNKYAYGSFGLSFLHRKNEFLNEQLVHRVVSKLGNNATIENVLSKYLPSFFKYFDMPIYQADAGEGQSLEALAKAKKIKLHQSDFHSITDLLYYFIAIYYSGDESLPYYDEQINLFMQCFYTVLYESMKDVSQSTKTALLEDLRKNFKAEALPHTLTTTMRMALGANANDVTVELMQLLLNPVIEMYSVDDDIPDIDAFLPASDAPAPNFLQKIVDFFKWVLDFHKRYWNGLFRMMKKH